LDGRTDVWVKARKVSCICWICVASGVICVAMNPWMASQLNDPAWVDVLAVLDDEASDSASEKEWVRLDATRLV
jgi:hypothetical protein